MSASRHGEDDLAARFLKLDHAYQGHACRTPQKRTEDSFGSLRNELLSAQSGDDMPLDDLLAELDGMHETNLSNSEEQQIHNLLAEAKSVLQTSVTQRASQHALLSEQAPRPDVEVETQQVAGKDDDREPTEDEEADDYIRAALDLSLIHI